MASKQSGGTRTPPITRAQYDLLLDSHRKELGRHKEAARAAAVTVSVATRTYTHGYGVKMPAIRRVLTDEMATARAKLAALSSEVDPEKITKTRADIAESRAQQARALRMTRSNALASMTISMVLLRAGASLTKRIEGLMTAVGQDGKPTWVPTPQEGVALLKQITEIARMSSEMNITAEEAEKRVLGAPDVVVAHTNLTVDQAVATLSTGKRMFERLKRRAANGDLPAELSPAVLQSLDAAEKDPSIH